MASPSNVADYVPVLKKDEGESVAITWASGNTKTVSNPNVRAGNVIVVMPTSAVAGQWYITVVDGSFTITSSDAESNVVFKYRIF